MSGSDAPASAAWTASTGGGLEPYRTELPYTYAFGHFASLEALKHRPEQVHVVLRHGDLEGRWREALDAAAARAGVPCARDDADVARLRRHDQVRCLAVVRKVEDVVLPGRDHVVLVGASQAGNVGSALRSLAAFGIEDVALVAPRVDIWSPHVLRASIGMRFAVRCARVASAEDYLAAHPMHRVYAFSASGSEELGSVTFQSPFSLWFGPEWPGAGAPVGMPVGMPVGTPAGTPTGTQSRVSVRIASRPHVESLNLAVAVSLAAYVAGKRVEGRK